MRKHKTTPSFVTSKPITDTDIIEKFDGPYLVSFPRTGSHWLRMLMELYFEQPTLVRTFYNFDSNNYLLLHTHDLELQVQRKDVLYLYREPIATIYSQLQYHHENMNDRDRIANWTGLYGKHLAKWLVTEKFTTKKTILTYENLQSDLVSEFSKAVAHFGQVLDKEKFALVAQKVTKEEVKRRTVHDENVVQLSLHYSQDKASFQKEYGEFVWDTLLKNHPQLASFF